MSDFKRETKYVVLKLKDMTDNQLEELGFWLERNEIPTRGAVVVESHLSCYEKAWELIEEEVKQNDR